MRPRRFQALGIRAFFATALFILTLYPIVLVLHRSVFGTEGFSLDFYREVYQSSANLKAMVNTIVISLGAVALGAVIAIPSAWLVARTDLPARRRFRGLLLLPYMIPPYLGAIAWINLCNPTVGWINRLAGAPVFNIYTTFGVVWVLAMFYYSFIYMNCLSAMENTDPSYEEAARVSGASPLLVFWTVTIPMIRPAILSGAFLVFAATAASFGVPALVGNPGGVHVLTTRIYAYIRAGTIDGPFMGAALSTSLFLVAIGASILADRLAHARRITALGGKSARISRVALGPWRWPAFAAIFGVFSLACLLPLASVILTSFMKVPGVFEADNLTLEKYRFILFERKATARGFANSFGLAAGAATLSIIAGLGLAYLKGHPRRRSGPVFDLCVNLPYATPGTILALGLILLWSGRIHLVDTLWILLIAYFAKYLSFAVKALTTNVQQIDPTLEEASRMSGAGFWRTFLRVWIPLLRPGMMASWFLIFMPVFSELTMSVLLVGPGTETVGTALFYLQEYGDPPAASVLAVLILVFVLGAYGLATLFGPRKSGAVAP
jgi:iron(III) transport system permease protein